MKKDELLNAEVKYYKLNLDTLIKKCHKDKDLTLFSILTILNGLQMEFESSNISVPQLKELNLLIEVNNKKIN